MERNLCLLIFLSLALNASEPFWFSYQVATNNKIIVYEEKNISPLMLKENLQHIGSTCRVKTVKHQYESTIHYLNRNFNKLIPCFYPYGTKIVNRTYLELKGIDERSVLTIPPIKFTVDFKDQFANINILLLH